MILFLIKNIAKASALAFKSDSFKILELAHRLKMSFDLKETK